MLAEKLNMDEPQAERWIVNLIRNAQLDAKIDTAKGVPLLLQSFMGVLFSSGHVIMGARTNSLHEQVMENTKRLSLRAQQIQVRRVYEEKR